MNDNTTSRNKKAADFFTKEILTVTLNAVQLILTEPTTPLIFMRNPVGLFYLWGILRISIQNKY
jgi:hypothetical protein